MLSKEKCRKKLPPPLLWEYFLPHSSMLFNRRPRDALRHAKSKRKKLAETMEKWLALGQPKGLMNGPPIKIQKAYYDRFKRPQKDGQCTAAKPPSREGEGKALGPPILKAGHAPLKG